MGSKLFFTLGFVIPFHVVKRITGGRTKGLELPVALAATETLKIPVFDPFQCALHCRILTPAASKTEQPLLPVPHFNPKLSGDSRRRSSIQHMNFLAATANLPVGTS
jgi:hypothetical protein